MKPNRPHHQLALSRKLISGDSEVLGSEVERISSLDPTSELWNSLILTITISGASVAAASHR